MDLTDQHTNRAVLGTSALPDSIRSLRPALNDVCQAREATGGETHCGAVKFAMLDGPLMLWKSAS